MSYNNCIGKSMLNVESIYLEICSNNLLYFLKMSMFNVSMQTVFPHYSVVKT